MKPVRKTCFGCKKLYYSEDMKKYSCNDRHFIVDDDIQDTIPILCKYSAAEPIDIITTFIPSLGYGDILKRLLKDRKLKIVDESTDADRDNSEYYNLKTANDVDVLAKMYIAIMNVDTSSWKDGINSLRDYKYLKVYKDEIYLVEVFEGCNYEDLCTTAPCKYTKISDVSVNVLKEIFCDLYRNGTIKNDIK